MVMSTNPFLKDVTIYIAGPMTGLPQFNIPAFERQTRRLRAAGYTVVSPVELDSELIRNEALASKTGAMPAGGKIGGETWGEILARDVRVIADTIDAICVLPNWQKSRGARLEVFVGMLCGKSIYLDETCGVYAERSLGIEEPPRLVPLAIPDIAFGLIRNFFN
jgi:hypothetical protein